MNTVYAQITTTATATPSAHDLPCQACTAHAPSFNYVVVAVAVALIVAYLLGRSHGADKTRKTLRRLFSDDKGPK